MNIPVPQHGGIWLAERTVKFSRRTLLHAVTNIFKILTIIVRTLNGLKCYHSNHISSTLKKSQFQEKTHAVHVLAIADIKLNNRFPEKKMPHNYCNGWLVVYFTTLFSVIRLYSVDVRVISEWWWIGKYLVGSGRGIILRYYPGIRLDGLRKTTPLPRQRFERGTSRIGSKSVNHLTTTFGVSAVIYN
jgi:hypothetical protein